jgi:hypothetical protein
VAAGGQHAAQNDVFDDAAQAVGVDQRVAGGLKPGKTGADGGADQQAVQNVLGVGTSALVIKLLHLRSVRL